MHRCPIPECPKQVGGDTLMCWGHWGRVPKPLRDEVWRTFRAMPLSPEHIAAMKAAIEAATPAAA